MGQVRTCISCRSRAHRSELTRIVVSEGQLLVDLEATAPGRGAWLHPNVKCVTEAVTRRSFRRALRIRDADDTDVRRYAKELAEVEASADKAKVVDRTMDQS